MEREKLSKAQADAKTYIERHGLEKLMKEMLNALVASKDTKPEIFMIKYFLQKLSPEDQQASGLQLHRQDEPEEVKTEPFMAEVEQLSTAHHKETHEIDVDQRPVDSSHESGEVGEVLEQPEQRREDEAEITQEQDH
jgi:hypothetical protein